MSSSSSATNAAIAFSAPPSTISASGPAGAHAVLEQWMRSAASDCRAELARRWDAQAAADRKSKAKRVHYLSMEFLVGRAMSNALAALGLTEQFDVATRKAGFDASAILEREPDAALGNGGLGRLAACFLDSMATLALPSFGYGLRYEFGMFAQRVHDGQQVEQPDNWLAKGNPWEIYRPELSFAVHFGGRVDGEAGSRRWSPATTVIASAYDLIIPGHGTERVSTLRQWHAAATQPLDFQSFSHGDYEAAAKARIAAESLNWVLYPDDSTQAGRELRLKQEYLLVSASLQDIVARHIAEHGNIDNIGRFAAIHLNDTHPALAAPELMRLLVDEHGMAWDAAFAQCVQAFSYTNHTLMPEALETWPVRMLESLLPRHLEIIYRMNADFLAVVRKKFPGNEDLVQQVSLIDEHGERRARMASLSIIASHYVNGVSALHSQLMVETIFAGFAQVFPERFGNITNGVTPRRWLMQANPALSTLLDKRLGDAWRGDLDALAQLTAKKLPASLLQDFRAAKRSNKVRLADVIRRDLGITVDPDSLFDVQVKRIHEYKRQLLNVLHVIARYQAILAQPNAPWVPRTVVFAGKAASAYVAAKSIIRLIHDVARVVNGDPRVRDLLKVVFLPNYSVSLAEVIIPAADLSEQISTAGTEASGTGNMKFAMNGALTIGTWDGANIEMAEAIGQDKLFIFGLRSHEVAQTKALGYDPRLHYEENAQLRSVIDAVLSGSFSQGDGSRYRQLMESLLHRDQYLLLADFASYVDTQQQVDALFSQSAQWDERAIQNVAGMGFFSTDRTIREYADKVWSMPVKR
ncbi:MAG: glycogen/starch/alpha-glucan phosphorylase [Burkholderiaceae bacterium]